MSVSCEDLKLINYTLANCYRERLGENYVSVSNSINASLLMESWITLKIQRRYKKETLMIQILWFSKIKVRKVKILALMKQIKPRSGVKSWNVKRSYFFTNLAELI